jgi:phospholipase/carboxylesterase
MSLYALKRDPKTNHTDKAIILLHGYGSNEEDLFSFANELDPNAYVISVRAPYGLDGFGYAWYAINFDAQMNKFSDNEQAKTSVQTIAKFIDEVKTTYNVNHVSLIGFSQGAILSYAVAFHYPEKVKQVIALSGYLNTDLLPQNFDTEKVKEVAFFASHGSVDQVIPVDWARKTKPFFEEHDLEIVYKEYPVGHGVAPQNFFDFRDWMV